MKPMKMKLYQVYMEPDLAERLRRHAKDNHMSWAAAVREACRMWDEWKASQEK